MTHESIPGAGLASLLLAGAALGQGADDCSQAQVITGLGLFPFDNTTATIDGPADCSSSTPARRDVWFAWTAPATASYVFSTCNLTSLEPRLVVYEGLTCPPANGTLCVQNSCGLTAHIPFAAQQGSQYLLRLGSKLVGAGGTGMFEIATDPCGALPDDNLEPNDTCATATCISDGTRTGLFVGKAQPDWYALEVAAGMALRVDLLFTHMNGNVNAALFDACGGTRLTQSTSSTNNETIAWINGSAATRRVLMRVEHMLDDPRADCTTYDMVVSGSEPCGGGGLIGISFCPTSPNSVGSGAMISAIGSPLATDQNIELRATGAPSDTLGLFFFGQNRAQLPLGQGLRCAGGPPVRVQPPAHTGPSNGNPAGEARLQLDFSAPYAVLLTPGTTLTAQYWYLDGANPNLSDGLELTLQ